MIDAKDAKFLYDKNRLDVTDFLKQKVEKEVIKAAEGGKRTVAIFLGSRQPFEHLHELVTPLQKAVVDKLIELGYRAEIKLDGDPYVPRGLANNDSGRGPMQENYNIYISW
jgi:hypothetical protein